ncbi:MAG: hypothetical protein Q4E91_04725 [Lachnospiraceae bacterium]|nr:hypothetical protein [Lachnospiraceae bacterium]
MRPPGQTAVIDAPVMETEAEGRMDTGEKIRRISMINYEEELKKFHPSMDVNEAEDAIYSRDLTDVTDILKEMLQDEKKRKK